jgi:hypothetical protein
MAESWVAENSDAFASLRIQRRPFAVLVAACRDDGLLCRRRRQPGAPRRARRGGLLAPQRVQGRRLDRAGARPGAGRQARRARDAGAGDERGRAAHAAPHRRAGRVRGRGRRRLGPARADRGTRGAAAAAAAVHDRAARQRLQPRGAARACGARCRQLGPAARTRPGRGGGSEPGSRPGARPCRCCRHRGLRLRPPAAGLLGPLLHRAPPPPEQGRVRLPLPRRHRRPAGVEQRGRVVPRAQRHPDPVGRRPVSDRPCRAQRAAGVRRVRLAPCGSGFAQVLRLFDAVFNHGLPVAQARAELAALPLPGALVDGFARGRPGMHPLAA